MAISKIKTGSITSDAITEAKVASDAITEAKIADGAVENEHLNTNVISGQTELSGSAADDDVLLIFDTSESVIKKVSSSNVGLQSPTISSISPTSVFSGDGTGNHTFIITGTKFAADVTANLITQSGADVSFNTVTRNSSTQITAVIAKSSLSHANEPYDVKVINAGALTATLTDQINVDDSPVFITASGSLGADDEGQSFSAVVTATDPDSAGTVIYELASGSLPPGITFTNTSGSAVFSGTLPQVNTTTIYNFTLRASDVASNTSLRAFSITSQHVPVRESFTASGTFTVPSGITAINVLVVGGGGGSAPGNAGGSGAGGLIFMPEYPVTTGTLTVTVGNGATNDIGQPSSVGNPSDPGLGQGGVLTARGGGRGNANEGGTQGGSGGGGGVPGGPHAGGQGLQPTEPGNSGAYGFGNNGGGGNPFSAGGGGGAGAGGIDGNGTACGGAGKAYTIADGTTPVYYAGGGGGYRTPGASPVGGQGGGGGAPGGTGQNGQANKGGGSGGGGPSHTGGKGIVIIAY
jgi:hypothetical protein